MNQLLIHAIINQNILHIWVEPLYISVYMYFIFPCSDFTVIKIQVSIESHMMDTCTIEEDSVEVVMMKKLPSKLMEGWISVSIYSLDILLLLSFLCLPLFGLAAGHSNTAVINYRLPPARGNPSFLFLDQPVYLAPGECVSDSGVDSGADSRRQRFGNQSNLLYEVT